MTAGEYAMLNAKMAVLSAKNSCLERDSYDYSGKTIDNVIQQLEAIRKEVSNERA